MPKFVRHRPGYTPEKAASRRRVREIARRLGIKPRSLNRKLPPVAWSSARFMLEAMWSFGSDLTGKFHSGGIITTPLEPLPLLFNHEHRVPFLKGAPYHGRPVRVAMHDAPKGAEVTLKLCAQSYDIDSITAGMSAEERERLEVMQERVAETVDKAWQTRMLALRRGGHVADVPARRRGGATVISNPGD